MIGQRRPPPQYTPPRRQGLPRWLTPAIIVAVLILSLVVFWPRPSGQDNGSSTTVAASAPGSIAASSTLEVSPTTSITATVVASPAAVAVVPADFAALQAYMLDLVNEDRRKNGQTVLSWDSTIAAVSSRHASEMANYDYTSHLNLDGYGPAYRYSLAGSAGGVQETLYSSQLGPEFTPTSTADWQQLVEQAQQALARHDQYKDVILVPPHTHLGIGIAYSADLRRLAIVQGFTGRYVALDPLLPRATPGTRLVVSGRLLAGATNPTIRLAYQALPDRKSIAELNELGNQQPQPQPYEERPISVDQTTQSFSDTISLDYQGQPGLYHVQIAVDTPIGQTLAVDAVIEVR